MKIIIAVISAFAISTTVPQACAVEKIEGLNNMASAQTSITDYFLTCTPCKTDMEGSVEDELSFRRALLKDKQATYYTKATPEQPRTENIVTHIERVVDARNGYITTSGADDTLEVTYTGAIFSGVDNKRIFAWTYYHQGGDSDAYNFQFFELNGTNWQDVSKYILPAYSIKDFAVGKARFKLNEGDISWEIALPRYGTTAYLLPHPSYEISEVDETFRIYNNYVGSNHALELNWDKKNGKFIKGRLLDLNNYSVALKKIRSK